jgi:hypothetical protein
VAALSPAAEVTQAQPQQEMGRGLALPRRQGRALAAEGMAAVIHRTPAAQPQAPPAVPPAEVGVCGAAPSGRRQGG